MKKLIELYVITFVLALVAIACIAYGYIYSDSTVFFTGCLIFFPLFCISYWSYEREYYGHFNNARY